MNWNNPDAYPGESEEEYNARKLEESQAADGLMSALVRLFVFFLGIAIVFGMFLYSGYFLSLKLLGEETDKSKIWGLAIFCTYLIFCIIYFLKGIVIGLRAKKNKLWILPWLICVLPCCFIPAFIVKSLVVAMFNVTARDDILCVGLSWAAFVLTLLYVYGIYQFKTPSAPRILYWSYALGLKVTR